MWYKDHVGDEKDEDIGVQSVFVCFCGVDIGEFFGDEDADEDEDEIDLQIWGDDIKQESPTDEDDGDAIR